MDTKTLLRKIGGQAAIARECGVSESAVSQWVSDDEIPAARKQYLQLAHPGEHWVEHEKYLASAVSAKPTAKTPEVAIPADQVQATPPEDNRRHSESHPVVIIPDRRTHCEPRPKQSKKRKGG